MKLSLIMPVYNEGVTLHESVQRLGKVHIPVPWELIVVDDGSTDMAVDGLERHWVPEAERMRVVRVARNRGKGAALRHGFELADGDIIGVQDADLEYDAAQLPELLQPLLDGVADVVYGSRQFGSHTAFSFWYVVGNRCISVFASALFNRLVTDAYSGYKFFTRRCLEGTALTLKADGFEIEAELTAAFLGSDARLFEVPIRYASRQRCAGKKIRAVDGVRGLWTLIAARLMTAHR